MTPRHLALILAFATTACSDTGVHGASTSSPDAGQARTADAGSIAKDASGDATSDATTTPDTARDDYRLPRLPRIESAVQHACFVVDDAAPCRIQTEFGAGEGCDVTLGVAFDGTHCREVTGCPCEGDACPDFTSRDTCARACHDQGWCGDEMFRGELDRNLCGGWCRDVAAVCVTSEVDPTKGLDLLHGGENAFICDHEAELPGACERIAFLRCEPDQWCCSKLPEYGPTGDAEARGMCRLSLLEDVTQVACWSLD